jgi:protocatechuate 3,4-dioxygenase beta subunit
MMRAHTIPGDSMSIDDELSRRRMLEMSLGLGGSALLGTSPLMAATLRRTPTQVLGPYYPMVKPLDQDADLTMTAGKSQRAAGQILHVMGCVTNAAGQPVPGARVEIWQANMYGRYTHLSDTKTDLPLDPNFDGFAVLTTDAEGRYRFKTIKPGGYNEGGSTRPPHIHFEVSGKFNRLVTQMYFAGDPLNAPDRFLATAPANGAQLIAPLLPPTKDLEPTSLLVPWDIVLENG